MIGLLNVLALDVRRRQGMSKDIQDNLSDIMTLPEVAKLLRISERNLGDMCKAKTIPSYKLGNLWRFNRRDLDEFIEQRKTVSY